jgi:hypothetical protein
MRRWEVARWEILPLMAAGSHQPRRGTVGHILTTHVVLDWPHPPSTGWMSHDDYHETCVGRYGTESLRPALL